MNKVALIGRLTRDPDIRRTQGENSMTVARYTLAVDRRYKKEGGQQADFISCIAFGKNGDFVDRYLRKGMKIAVTGRIQTGSYTTAKGRRSIRLMWSWKSMTFARAKALPPVHPDRHSLRQWMLMALWTSRMISTKTCRFVRPYRLR